MLTSAASAGNSGLFSTSRMMYNLSKNHLGPKFLSTLNKNFVPGNALFISSIVVSIGALLSYIIPDTAFSIVTTISAICFIWVWSIILITHIIYLRKTPDLHKTSIFKAPLAPFVNYVVLIFFVAVLVVMLISEETRMAVLLTPIWFIILFITYALRKKKLAQGVFSCEIPFYVVVPYRRFEV